MLTAVLAQDNLRGRLESERQRQRRDLIAEGALDRDEADSAQRLPEGLVVGCNTIPSLLSDTARAAASGDYYYSLTTSKIPFKIC